MRYVRIYFESYKGLSRETWMLAAVMLINRAGSMVLPFLGVYMVDHLHFGIKESGMVLSFYGIGSVLGSWLGGLITDRVGEYKVQSMSLFLSVPLFCVLPLFTSIEGLATIILLQSIISEMFRPANSVAITKYAKSQNLTRAFSLNRMAVNLGFSIGPAMGGILSSISYDFLFYCNALGALLAGIVYVIFFRKRHTQTGFTRKERKAMKADATLAPELSPYRDRPFLIFCFLCVIFSVCFFQFFSTLPIFYKDEVGLSQKAIGYILGYSGLVIVLLEMVLVKISEKWLTIGGTLMLGAVLCGMSYAMLAFNHSLFVLVFAMTLLCIGEILTLPFLSTVTALRSGVRNKGAYMGLNGMSFSMAFIITPFLGTRLANDHGFNSVWIGTGVLLVITAVALYINVQKMLGKNTAHQ